MNIKSYFKMAILNIFRDKKKVYFVFVMVICTILALGVLNFKSIFYKHISDSINKNIGFRVIDVIPKLDIEDYGKSEIIKIKHIDDIYSSQYGFVYVKSSFANEKLDGSMELIYGETSALPNNIIGETFKKGQKNVAICPIDFYPDISIYDTKINEKNIIDGNTLLGKNFTVKYYSYSFNGNKKTIEAEFTKTFKIVGLYDSKSVMNMGNQCYASFEDIKEIKDKGIISDINTSIYAFSIIVDSSQNVNYVMDKLEELGFTGIRLKNQIDQKLVNTIIISCDVTVTLVLFAVILLAFSYTKKKILGEAKTIGVLRTSGYKKSDVINLYSLEIIIISAFSYIIGTMIFTIIYLILKNFVFHSLTYFGIVMSLNVINYIYAFILIVVITSIIADYYIIKKINLNIVDLIGSEE